MVLPLFLFFVLPVPKPTTARHDTPSKDNDPDSILVERVVPDPKAMTATKDTEAEDSDSDTGLILNRRPKLAMAELRARDKAGRVKLVPDPALASARANRNSFAKSLFAIGLCLFYHLSFVSLPRHVFPCTQSFLCPHHHPPNLPGNGEATIKETPQNSQCAEAATASHLHPILQGVVAVDAIANTKMKLSLMSSQELINLCKSTNLATCETEPETKRSPPCRIQGTRVPSLSVHNVPCRHRYHPTGGINSARCLRRHRHGPVVSNLDRRRCPSCRRGQSLQSAVCPLLGCTAHH